MNTNFIFEVYRKIKAGNSKKGFSLIEVLAAAMILSIITIAIVFTLTFSQNMVQENSNADAYAAEAQSAADGIMCLVNGGRTSGAEIQIASYTTSGATYIYAGSGFNEELEQSQFLIQQVPSSEFNSMYKITVRRYYGFENHRKHVELTCYSHSDW